MKTLVTADELRETMLFNGDRVCEAAAELVAGRAAAAARDLELRLESAEAMVVALIEDVVGRDRRIEELSECFDRNSRADGRVFRAVLDVARSGVDDPRAKVEAARAVVRAACRRFCDFPPALPAESVLACVGADGEAEDVGLSRAERIGPGLYDVELTLPVEGPIRVDVGALAILGVWGNVAWVAERRFRVAITDGHTSRPVDGAFALLRGDGPDAEAERYLAAVGGRVARSDARECDCVPDGRGAHAPKCPMRSERRLRLEVVPRTSEGFGWGEVREFTVPGGEPVRIAVIRGKPDDNLGLGSALLDEVSKLSCRCAVILPPGTELEVVELVP